MPQTTNSTLSNPSVSIPFEEYLVATYDDLTTRWRHYHDFIEVSRRYYEKGYSSQVLSPWDNPYEFGLVAIKVKQEATSVNRKRVVTSLLKKIRNGR